MTNSVFRTSTDTYILSIAAPLEKTWPNRRRYPLSLQIFKEIVAAFRVPSSFINIAISCTTLTFELEDESLNSGRPRFSHSEAGCKEHDPIGVVASLGPWSLAVTFDRDTQTTYGLALGLCEHQAARLLDTMRASIDEMTLPMSLPLMWLNILGELRARRVMGRQDAITRSEADIGIHWSKDGEQINNSLRDVDFDNLTRRLTVIGSEVAWDIHALEAQSTMADAFENVQRLLDSSGLMLQSDSRAAKAFRTRLRYARQLIRGLRTWTVYTQQRAHVQLQTVK